MLFKDNNVRLLRGGRGGGVKPLEPLRKENNFFSMIKQKKLKTRKINNKK